MLVRVPPRARVDRVLDLGTGDGSTLALVLAAHPDANGVGVDFQDEMLRRARERFASDARVEIARTISTNRCRPTSGRSTSSCRASRSITSSRPRSARSTARSSTASAGRAVRQRGARRFAERRLCTRSSLAAIGQTPETDDPSNKLVAVPTHLDWLDDLGFRDAECFWKWRELAVITGVA